MSKSVKSVVIFGFKLNLEKEQMIFLEQETSLNVFPVAYDASYHDTNHFLVGEIVAESDHVQEVNECNTKGLDEIEPQIVKILNDAGVNFTGKAKLLMTSHYY